MHRRALVMHRLVLCSWTRATMKTTRIALCLRRRILHIVILIILFTSVISTCRRQTGFESFLQSLSISFEDFPADYQAALGKAKKDNTPVDYDLDHLANGTSMIARKIHFIWFKNLYDDASRPSHIPTTGSNAPTECRKSNANFEIIIWNSTAARNLLVDHYAWFIPTYDNYHYPIQRVDAFKYFVLWHFGGIYMDLDITCRRSLEPLVHFPAWFPKAQPFGVNNDLMATRKHHPIMRRMIESLYSRDKSLIFPYLTIFWSTGPQFTSDMVKTWWRDIGAVVTGTVHGKENDMDSIYVLPLPFYSEEYSFFGHSPGGTWHGSDVAVVLWFVERPWLAVMLAISPLWVALITLIWRKWPLNTRKVERRCLPV
ncbi:hypothetical protein KVT40_009062 [Elsinoe batatas]|uniref:Glycosyltransferase family 32 protein n=1 Tax=Elsinoe batatas TaxID=2601811 RepID=A0A8K0KU90_9PEZI|nr:hypothetical protein KVT40_009062 [Elsinoe batatas]